MAVQVLNLGKCRIVEKNKKWFQSYIRFRNVYQLLFSPTTLEQLLFGHKTQVVGQSILEVAEDLGEHVGVTKL
jgi:hypothetical protein